MNRAHPHSDFLTDAEARRIITRNLPGMSVTNVNALIDIAFGWPRLLTHAIDVLKQVGAQGNYDLSYARQAVRDSLRLELMPTLPEAWRSFLSYAATVKTMWIREASELLVGPDQPSVATLTSLGIVRMLLIDNQPGLQLMPELANLISLEDDLQPELRHETLQRVARIRSRLGVGDAGLRAAYELRDWPLCADILDRWIIRHVYFGGFNFSNRVLAELPADLVRERPRLVHRAELLKLLPIGEVPPPSLASLDASTFTGGEYETAAAAWIQASAMAIAARRFQGHHAEAYELALTLEPKVRELSVMTHTEHAQAACAWFVESGFACVLADDFPAAQRMWTEAWRLRDVDVTQFYGTDVAYRLALTGAWTGGLPSGREWLALANERPLRLTWATEFARRIASLAELAFALDNLDLERAQNIRRGLGDPFMRDETWPIQMWLLGWLLIYEGNAHDVADLMSRIPSAHSAHLQKRTAITLRAEAELALGHGTAAGSTIREVSTVQGAPTRARLALLAGQFVEAQTLATQGVNDPAAFPRTSAELLLIKAAAAVAQGDLVTAQESLNRSNELDRHTGTLRTLLAIPRHYLAPLEPLSEELRIRLGALDASGLVSPYPETVTLIDLTEREGAVLDMLADGLEIAQIAAKSFVSVNTIKSQLRTLYAKLGVHSRSEALARATELGLLPA